MDDEVVYFDFRRKVRKSTPVSSLQDINLPTLLEDLNEVLEIFENARDKESLCLSEDEMGHIDILNFMCDKFAEECHRLGIDQAPEIEVTLEPEKEDD